MYRMSLILECKYCQLIVLKNILNLMANIHSLIQTDCTVMHKSELSLVHLMKSLMSKTIDLDIHKCYLKFINQSTKN
jgi:hypothetical protein